jgi:hypothetical protein
VVAGALVTALAFLLPIPGRETIFYTPYPALMPPSLALTVGVTMWGLLTPVAVWLVANR